jgi:hypothetical protein
LSVFQTATIENKAVDLLASVFSSRSGDGVHFSSWDWNWGQIGEVLGRLNPLVIVGRGFVHSGNLWLLFDGFYCFGLKPRRFPFSGMPENPFLGFLHQPYAQFGYRGPVSDVVYNHHTKRRLESVFSVVVDRMVGV